MLDYIIVGCGLAGISFAETLTANNKSFIVINDDSQCSSKVAAGTYNPIILKRFSSVWNAKQQLNVLDSFYLNLEQKLNIKLDYKLPVYRKLVSIEEQNNWFAASDKPLVSEYLSTELINTKFNHIDSSFGFGKVLKTGYVDTKLLLINYEKYLISQNLVLKETFDYSKVSHNADFVCYKNLKSKHIIFAEGFGLNQNPYFNYIPLDGTKGELLLIKAPDLNLDVILNSSLYIVPFGKETFKVGATYEWDDKTNSPTENGLNELLTSLKAIINCDFEIIEHLAGIRPTVKDRRPLVGTHPKHKNIHVFNGLGTRGVMIAPELAIVLFNHIENNEPLDEYVDIKRYQKFCPNLD